MDAERRAALEEVGEHCDVVQRIELIPYSACIRGMYFQGIANVLAQAGCSGRYHALFPERFAAVSFHPLRDFLVRLAVGGGLLCGARHVHDGMFEIGRRNAQSFASSLFGRILLRALSPAPKTLCKQGIASRRLSAQPARWDLSFPDDRTAIMEMREEYLYIEAYQRGGALGAFEATGIPVSIEVQLDDAFNGRHIVRW